MTFWVGLSRSAEVGGLSQQGGLLSFAGAGANGEVAPIPAVRGTAIGRLKSTDTIKNSVRS